MGFLELTLEDTVEAPSKQMILPANTPPGMDDSPVPDLVDTRCNQPCISSAFLSVSEKPETVRIQAAFNDVTAANTDMIEDAPKAPIEASHNGK